MKQFTTEEIEKIIKDVLAPTTTETKNEFILFGLNDEALILFNKAMREELKKHTNRES